jgi:hypothetical protein
LDKFEYMEVNNEIMFQKHSVCMRHVALPINISTCNARE